MTNTTKNIHEGRNVKRFREMLGIKQDALAFELGEEWNQQRISLLEQKDTIDIALLKQISEVLKIPVQAFQNFDDLKGDYSSWTRNRKIAAIFKEAQFIEKYGSGIKRIREGFNAHGLVPPVFENFQQGFRVIVHSKEPDDGVSGAVSGGVNLLLDLIEKHPGQKVPFFVTQTSIPGRTVQRWITKLKKENRVEFRGAPKTVGYWLKD